MATVQEFWKMQLEQQWGIEAQIEGERVVVRGTDDAGESFEWSFNPQADTPSVSTQRTIADTNLPAVD